MTSKTVLVELDDIRAAVRALEEEAAAGTISQEEALRRINDSKRAVTPRELFKASGGRAGSRGRSDWYDIRRTAFAAALLLVLAALGVWIVTIYTGKAAGDGGYIPDLTPSVTVPAEQTVDDTDQTPDDSGSDGGG